MKILLVAATSFELRNFLDRFNQFNLVNAGQSGVINFGNVKIDVIITGVGVPMMLFQLGKIDPLMKYDLFLSVGIAGSFKKNIRPGSIVMVTSEVFGDLGVMREETFHNLWENGLNQENLFPFRQGILHAEIPAVFTPYFQYPRVKGITVGSMNSGILERSGFREKYDPDVESMEGAAFFLFCLGNQIPGIQLRAISNYTSDHDSRTWDMKTALENLDNELTLILELMAKDLQG